MRVGVDSGGTFTDVVVFDEEQHSVALAKVLTTPAALAQGVQEGLAKAAVPLGAVSLHSYRAPEHEVRMCEILHATDAHLFVTTSHELSREYREYERTSTTVANAYVGPIVSTYLGALERRLAQRGALHVGPRSAGAEPGPVCYGRGGTEPTITDANVVLGRLAPEQFLGGEMRLDCAAAEAALRERVATPLGVDLERAAAGMLEVATASMADTVRHVTIEQGLDPRDFTLEVVSSSLRGSGLSRARSTTAPSSSPAT